MQPDDFWLFSVSLYSRHGVEDACLNLQNSLGLDVNLVLFCCWYGVRWGTLPDELLAAAVAWSQPWAQQVVKPLRSARSWMKASDETMTIEAARALREQIKSMELAAEKLQQQQLQELAEMYEKPVTRGGREATLSNLRSYLMTCGLNWNEEIEQLTGTLLTALSSTDQSS